MSHGPYFVSREDAKAYIADFVRSPIVSTFTGLHVHCGIGLYRYRSQYRPNTCIGVALTKTKPALVIHDQVHMYLYNIYRPYLHNWNMHTG